MVKKIHLSYSYLLFVFCFAALIEILRKRVIIQPAVIMFFATILIVLQIKYKLLIYLKWNQMVRAVLAKSEFRLMLAPVPTMPTHYTTVLWRLQVNNKWKMLREELIYLTVLEKNIKNMSAYVQVIHCFNYSHKN